MFPFPVHLDGKVVLRGAYSGATQVTTWTLPFPDPAIDTAVLSNEFENEAGRVLTGLRVSGNLATHPGNFGNRWVALGRSFVQSLELSRQYRRDRDGLPLVGDRLQIAEVAISHADAGEYEIRAQMPGRRDQSRRFEHRPGAVDDTGTTRATIVGWAKDLTIRIESRDPRPCTFTGAVIRASVGPNAEAAASMRT